MTIIETTVDTGVESAGSSKVFFDSNANEDRYCGVVIDPEGWVTHLVLPATSEVNRGRHAVRLEDGNEVVLEVRNKHISLAEFLIDWQQAARPQGLLDPGRRAETYAAIGKKATDRFDAFEGKYIDQIATLQLFTGEERLERIEKRNEETRNEILNEIVGETLDAELRNQRYAALSESPELFRKLRDYAKTLPPPIPRNNNYSRGA